jgi:hypothetical protein
MGKKKKRAEVARFTSFYFSTDYRLLMGVYGVG